MINQAFNSEMALVEGSFCCKTPSSWRVWRISHAREFPNVWSMQRLLGGAFGTFEVTHDCTDLTSASFLNKVGKKTECVMRISTVGGETGSADTARDVHGFAMKLYTDQGNQDFVFNNTPVFFIRDPQKFPSLNHSHKRHPATNLPDATMVGVMELHWRTWLTSLVLGDGSFKYVKFHVKTTIGVKNLTREEATKLAGENPDHLVQDMYEAIDRGDHPVWNVFVQVMDPKEAENYKWNIFDMTKVWPHTDFPLRQIGRLTLNRNPKNYFVDIEQASFSPSTMVPGIAPSADLMLQARMFSYPDAQRYRLGVNYQQLPVNSARAPVHCPFERSGAMNFGSNYGDEPNYVGSSLKPNTFAKSSNGAGPVSSTFTEHEKWIGKVCSYASGVDEKDYEQAAGLWKVLGREEGHQDRLVGNVAASVSQIKHAQLRKRVYEMFSRVDGDLGKRLEMETEANLA
ncbi:catalase-like domain-containing protein [Aspergillus floccosus]